MGQAGGYISDLVPTKKLQTSNVIPANLTTKNGLVASSKKVFRLERLYAKYPWMELGYTYDWNTENPTHVGMSEFVIDVKKDNNFEFISGIII